MIYAAIDEPQNNPNANDYLIYDLIYKKGPEKASLYRKHITGCLGMQVQEWMQVGMWDPSAGMVFKGSTPDGGDGCITRYIYQNSLTYTFKNRWILYYKDNMHSLTFTKCIPCVKHYCRYCGIISEYRVCCNENPYCSGKRQTSKQINSEVICKWYKNNKNTAIWRIETKWTLSTSCTCLWISAIFTRLLLLWQAMCHY